MNTRLLLAALLVAMPGPGSLVAQAGVQVETNEDEMDSWTYAYTRADGGPILSMDDRGLVFGRTPHLIFVCSAGEVDVIYMFDTELIGEEGTVLVQSRFDTRPPSSAEQWPLVVDPTSAAEIEAAVVAMGVEEGNPFMEMFAEAAVAANLKGEAAETFLGEGGNAERVTMRVTDQFDGETHTDVFSLAGLSDAVEQVRATCQR